MRTQSTIALTSASSQPHATVVATSHGHHLTGFPTPVSHCQLAASSTCPLWSDLTHFHTSSLELSLTFFPTFDNLLQVTFFVTSRQPLHSARSSACALRICLASYLTATYFSGFPHGLRCYLSSKRLKVNVGALDSTLLLQRRTLVQANVVDLVPLVVINGQSPGASHFMDYTFQQLSTTSISWVALQSRGSTELD